MVDLLARMYRNGRIDRTGLARCVAAGLITLDEAKMIVATGGDVGAFADEAA